MDEVLLIQECLKGKRKAQGELYRRYAAKMMGVCMRYSRNRDMAHDLLQEGFIKVFTNLNEYSGVSRGGCGKFLLIVPWKKSVDPKFSL